MVNYFKTNVQKQQMFKNRSGDFTERFLLKVLSC